MKAEQLTKLHILEVEILDEIVRICNKYNLKYYLIAGTLLGAVRHGGFIPWDDDLDIAMPRNDYEQFCNLCKEELNEEYYLHSIETDESYWLPFVKVRRKNTIFDESLLSDTNVKMNGIYVDIFPLDYETAENHFAKRIRTSFLSRMQYLIVYKLHGKTPHSFSGRLLFPFVKRMSFKKLNRIQSKVMAWCNKRVCSYYVNYCSKYDKIKQTMPITWYEPFTKIEFCKKKYNAPAEYLKILERIYGSNFMELPPMDKQITHNPVRLSFDTNGPDEVLTDEKKKVVGYTTGVFDLFHIGHLNILRRAKEQCDYLIVGVSTDEVVQTYKHKRPIIPFSERIEIVKAIKYVDEVVPQTSMDKMEAWRKFKFDKVFHGDDWKGSEMYNKIVEDLENVGCEMVFLPHTDGVSSSQITKEISDAKKSHKD